MTTEIRFMRWVNEREATELSRLILEDQKSIKIVDLYVNSFCLPKNIELLSDFSKETVVSGVKGQSFSFRNSKGSSDNCSDYNLYEGNVDISDVPGSRDFLRLVRKRNKPKKK